MTTLDTRPAPTPAGMTITPLTGHIGAQIDGVDLADLSDAEFAAVQAALLEHQVIFFRSQAFPEEAHMALTERWGTPMLNPVTKLLGDAQAMNFVENSEKNPPAADSYHTDLIYWAEPPNLAILHALDIPPAGGDTLWVSLYAAYEALSDRMKEVVAGLAAVHRPSDHFVQASIRVYGSESEQLIRENLRGAILPLVRTHDETGRQALFLSSFIKEIDGLHPAESAALLTYLHTLVEDPNYAVRWRWRAGDVAIWDERSTNHRALSDHGTQYRLMRRTTVEGAIPFYRPDGADAPSIVGRFA